MEETCNGTNDRGLKVIDGDDAAVNVNYHHQEANNKNSTYY